VMELRGGCFFGAGVLGRHSVACILVSWAPWVALRFILGYSWFGATRLIGGFGADCLVSGVGATCLGW